MAKFEGEVPDEVVDRLMENFKLAQQSTDQLDAYMRCRAAGRLAEFRKMRLAEPGVRPAIEGVCK